MPRRVDGPPAARGQNLPAEENVRCQAVLAGLDRYRSAVRLTPAAHRTRVGEPAALFSAFKVVGTALFVRGERNR